MNLSDIFVASHHCLALSLALTLTAFIYSLRFVKTKSSLQPSASTSQAIVAGVVNRESVQRYRNIYFRLQNLEDHPDVLVPARKELLRQFSRGLLHALERPQSSILSMEEYKAERFHSFVDDVREKVLAGYSEYLARRKQGHAPDLFGSAEEARIWLIRQAPSKLIDGAWLGHFHKVTTPFALRGVTKIAWQVLSEEYGDGDLSKHHVYLYQKLLKDIGSAVPDAHTVEFINLGYWNDSDNCAVWEAAVTQLLISLFPNEFFPEILGFNMHFEMITVETMKAAHELKGLGVDPYYFFIHMAIDNSESGHTAMAAQAVTQYLELVRDTEGGEAMQQIWRRIQAGYLLSESQGGGVDTPKGTSPCKKATRYPQVPSLYLPKPLQDPISIRMIEIFKAKASASQNFHCHSKVRIGSQSLSDWLEPAVWKHPDRRKQQNLLDSLSRAKPWISPGSSSKSRLVRELSWEGRMFGAFTNSELATLCSWIDNLEIESEASLYWKFIQRKPVSSEYAVAQLQDPARHHPVLPAACSRPASKSVSYLETNLEREAWVAQKRLNPLSVAQLPALATLWFAHISLLENTINVPSRAASPIHASILRILRVQAGFAEEADTVAGMDELRRHSCTSLVDIGLELVHQMDESARSRPACVRDVFVLASKRCPGHESSDFANDLLSWSMRPVANLGLLIGLSMAFVGLKVAVARAPDLLSVDSRLALEAIVAREKSCLEECVLELSKTDEAQYRLLEEGFHFGMDAVRKYL